MQNGRRSHTIRMPMNAPVSSYPEAEEELGFAFIQSATYSKANSKSYRTSDGTRQPILSIRGRDVRDRSDFTIVKRPA